MSRRNHPPTSYLLQGELKKAGEKFEAAGGAQGKRTIAANWRYVEVQWLMKIKTDSEGNVHYEAWSQPASGGKHLSPHA